MEPAALLAELREAKAMLDEALISRSEYDAVKAKVLQTIANPAESRVPAKTPSAAAMPEARPGLVTPQPTSAPTSMLSSALSFPATAAIKKGVSTTTIPAGVCGGFSQTIPAHPFETDYNDHFETSPRAYRDIEPILSHFATLMGKQKSDVVIYDPYYCAGAVKAHFASLGFPRVENDNVDCYAAWTAAKGTKETEADGGRAPSMSVGQFEGDVGGGQADGGRAPSMSVGQFEGDLSSSTIEDAAAGKGVPPHDIIRRDAVAGKGVPPHDIIITNPPFSGDHKERCLRYMMASGKPWMCVLPSYCAARQYFVRATLDHQRRPFFAVPQTRYEFEHPEGTGHRTSPFTSIWILDLGDYNDAVVEWYRKEHGPRGALKLCRAAEELARLSGSGVSTQKRKNPRQRRRRVPPWRGNASLLSSSNQPMPKKYVNASLLSSSNQPMPKKYVAKKCKSGDLPWRGNASLLSSSIQPLSSSIQPMSKKYVSTRASDGRSDARSAKVTATAAAGAPAPAQKKKKKKKKRTGQRNRLSGASKRKKKKRRF
jgi:hypothetical protein